ncbi:LOW QUALITY PROTEIN: uncharacterized protein Dere_GG16678, partial [Drosophila erecta]
MMMTVSMTLMKMMMMGNTGSWPCEQLSLKVFPFLDTLMKCKIIWLWLNGQKRSLDGVGMPLLWLSRCNKINLISIPGPAYWNSPREIIVIYLRFKYFKIDHFPECIFGSETPKGAAEKAILTGSHFPHH